jgi:hypothetical protein
MTNPEPGFCFVRPSIGVQGATESQTDASREKGRLHQTGEKLGSDTQWARQDRLRSRDGTRDLRESSPNDRADEAIPRSFWSPARRRDTGAMKHPGDPDKWTYRINEIRDL